MGKLTFITGGVRSGKSAFAERLVEQLGYRKECIYIATGVAFDQEMQKRIERHQQDRNQGPLKWQTIEMQTEFPKVVETYARKEIVLFECVTTWLSNILYYTEQASDRHRAIAAYINGFKEQLTTWKTNGVNVVIVSNEVLDEPPSGYEEVNLYRQTLGQLHQWIVYNSDEAYEVQFQLVQQWK
ncbi:bifunctional adenosylcobinamide kinase/adenosylcobinamide-phosphate guanylyltransferase [Solibacillus sp. FSL H8-0538]|uniref:bifunctional adenosylcobinamide kinase/adenosylcobinamide-phosphate guanylyltransferase n=1 Tax=Solibacillus sp. FSL H8-0538 TaxID=2921400 RepID=UPI0030F977BD